MKFLPAFVWFWFGIGFVFNLSSNLIADENLPAISKHTLLVTHASKAWDWYSAAKPGIDRLIRKFNDEALPVLFLIGTDGVGITEQDRKAWYTDDQTASKFVNGIQLKTPISSNELTIVGGHFGACHLITLASAISNHKGNSNLVIHLPMDAIYTNPSQYPGIPSNHTFMTLEQIWVFDGNKQQDVFAQYLWNEMNSLVEGCHLCYVLDTKKAAYQFHLYIKGTYIKKIGAGAKNIHLIFE